MPIVRYGTWGFPLLLFPTAAADFEEYERFYLIETMRPWIEAGKVSVYSIDSVNQYTWMDDRIHPADRAVKHDYYDSYVVNEVVPFIWGQQGNSERIITSGSSMGAYHALNFMLRHPDLFGGTVAMSGAYDLTPWTGGYMDERVYFNSPLHYVPDNDDPWFVEQWRRNGKDIHILTGQGPFEAPSQSKRMSQILWDKGVWHNLELWGHDMPHDWPTWRKMMPAFLAYHTN